jgi:hypothetical protein
VPIWSWKPCRSVRKGMPVCCKNVLNPRVRNTVLECILVADRPESHNRWLIFIQRNDYNALKDSQGAVCFTPETIGPMTGSRCDSVPESHQ